LGNLDVGNIYGLIWVIIFETFCKLIDLWVIN